MNKNRRQLPRSAVTTGELIPIWMQGCTGTAANQMECILVDSDGEPIPAANASGEGNPPIYLNDGVTNTVHQSVHVEYKPQGDLAGLLITFDPVVTLAAGYNVVLPRASTKYRSAWGGTLSTFFGKVESV